MSVLLLLKKTQGVYRCVIADSLGGGNLFGDMLTGKVSNMLEKFTTNSPQIFCYRGEPRQIAQTNCPLFCLSDAVEFSHHTDLFEYCEDMGKRCVEKSTNPHIVYFHQLPSEMMRIAQTLSTEANLIERKFLKYVRILIAEVIAKHNQS